MRLLAEGLAGSARPRRAGRRPRGVRQASAFRLGRAGWVDLARAGGAADRPLVVEYHGRPDGKGLRAGDNAHGDPTLFADNWPENARRWIPSVDHPSDKATVDFTITAEDRYEVVAPGASSRRARCTTGGARRAGARPCRSRRTAWSSASPSSR
jgi:hypothetical protein